MVRRERGIGERRGAHGIEIAEGHQQPARHAHEVGHAAVVPDPGRELPEVGGVLAVVLGTDPALHAMTAAPWSVDGHGLVHRQSGDAGAELGDVPGDLVAEDERWIEGHGARRELHQMEVAVACPGGSNAEQHLAGARFRE